ncbi:hypothetical protein D3C87_1858050 [compost metagenome]
MPHDLASSVDNGNGVWGPKEGTIRELRHLHRFPRSLGVEQGPAKLHEQLGAENVVAPRLGGRDAPRCVLRVTQWNLAARKRSNSQHVDE